MKCKCCGNNMAEGETICELCGTKNINYIDKVNEQGEDDYLEKDFESEFGMPPVADDDVSTTQIQNWKRMIEVLDSKRITEEYDNEEDYCNTYRLLCYEELKRRYQSQKDEVMRHENGDKIVGNCVECGAELPQDAKFCPDCGEKVSREERCICGYILKENYKFCPKCGKKR